MNAGLICTGLLVAACSVPVSARLPENSQDEAALVQMHPLSAEVALAESAGHTYEEFPIEVDALVFERPSKPRCEPNCHEVGLTITVNGRSLTFVIKPGSQDVRVDGKLGTQQLGFRPDYATEHKLFINLRSHGLHTFTVKDGKTGQTWTTDFHHTGFFPTYNRQGQLNFKLKLRGMNLKANAGHYKCFNKQNLDNCLKLLALPKITQVTEPYISTKIPTPCTNFLGCSGYGEAHFLPYRGGRLNFRGQGVYVLSQSHQLKMTTQVFGCPLNKRTKNGGKVTVISGVAIQITPFHTISKVGPVTKLNGVPVANGFHELRGRVELDVAEKFIIVKGPMSSSGDFAEVKVKLGLNDLSPTGDILRVTTYLPEPAVPSSSGICLASKGTEHTQAITDPDDILFDPVDTAALQEACCPGGCKTGIQETVTDPVELCDLCPEYSFDDAQRACAVYEDTALLHSNCLFDSCELCRDEVEETEDVTSEEGPALLEERCGDGHLDGDPHARNVRGENFDILQVGHVQMVEVPRVGEKRGSSLEVSAVVGPISNYPCAPTVIQRIDVRGSWLPTRLHLRLKPTSTGIPDIQPAWKDWMAKPASKRSNYTLHVTNWRTAHGLKSVIVVRVGPVTVNVLQRRGARTGADYFDLDVKGLKDLGEDAGGLLGLDAHIDAAKPQTGCHIGQSSRVNLAEGGLEEVHDDGHTQKVYGENYFLSGAMAS